MIIEVFVEPVLEDIKIEVESVVMVYSTGTATFIEADDNE